MRGYGRAGFSTSASLRYFLQLSQAGLLGKEKGNQYSGKAGWSIGPEGTKFLGSGEGPYLLLYLHLPAEIREAAEGRNSKALIWELPGHLVWGGASETRLWEPMIHCV